MVPDRWGLWILAAAAVVRLLVLVGTNEAGLLADMEQYHGRAVYLFSNGQLYPDALRGPGYPGFLAAGYVVAGEPSLWVARILNVGLGVLMVLLTNMLARQAGAGRFAWVAGAIVAVYPAWILFAVYLMPEGLYTVVALAALLLLSRASVAAWAVAGAACGVAMLTRSVGISLMAAAFAVSVWPAAEVRLGRRAVRFGVFAAACAVVVAPWLAFTTRVAGGPLLDSTSGFNLLAGNNPRATGRLELDQGEWLDATYVRGAASVSAGNAKAIAAAVGWARDHPREWLGLAGAKLGYLFGLDGREHAWLYGNNYFGPRSPGAVWAWGLALMVSFPLLALLAALGMGAGLPKEPSHVAMVAFLMATTLLHVASFGESRFHLPLVPVLGVAVSLAAARHWWRPQVRWLVPAALVLALLGPAWTAQARQLGNALSVLSQPGGSTVAPPY